MTKTTYKKQRKKDWYRLKRYVHIGPQLEPKDRKWLTPYVKNKDAIAKHIFYPFIHTELKTRRFRREISSDGSRSEMRVAGVKERPLSYSNHVDAKVFSYYAELLTKKYDKLIDQLEFDECITAYRRIKLDTNKKGRRNKCNIDFANDVFEFVKSKKKENLLVIAFDIKSFFDSLDHKLLKKKWRQVIDSGNDLPSDHYNIFRSITHFSYINESDLFDLFKDRMIVQKVNKGTDKIIRRRKRVDRKRYFRKENVVSYCDKPEIEEIRAKGLIKSNKYIQENGEKKIRRKGIPQGSPISATLANIYMIDFDKVANEFLRSLGGIYRRYSDDMVIVCPIKYEENIFNFFNHLANENHLNLQDEKTQCFHFLFDEDNCRHYCYKKSLQTNILNKNKSFEYLGFQFDGFYVRMKDANMSKYYRKMKSEFARRYFYALHDKSDETKGKIFKSSLYKNHTHKGAGARAIYVRHPHKENHFMLSRKYYWGNFITYAQKAKNTFPDNKIKGQIKQHWNKFHELMSEVEDKIDDLNRNDTNTN